MYVFAVVKDVFAINSITMVVSFYSVYMKIWQSYNNFRLITTEQNH
jgi:hypothetical protein